MWFRKNKEKKETRRLLIIRYVELFIICIGTIGLTLGLRALYRNDQSYQNTIPVIRGTLAEIKPSEVETYIFENEDALLYIGTAQNEDCRKIEKEFKKYILEKGLQDKITYLNIPEIVTVDTYLEELNSKYDAKIKIDNVPTIVLFHNGKISTHIGGKNKILTMENIKLFLDSNKIKGIKE